MHDATTLLLVRLLCTVGMCVVVPIGLRLTGVATVRLARAWPWCAGLGAVSMFLPRSGIAVALAVVYLAMTVVLAARAPAWLTRDLAVTTALASPLIAAIALVAERAGVHLFGFSLGLLALTVAHFHAAGFAAALIAALAGRRGGRLAGAARLSVPIGIATVLVGFFTNAWVGLVGTMVLTAGMWLVSWATWQATGRDRLTRFLLGFSAVVLLGTMTLALDWAAGRAIGVPHLSIEWMAATHGVANMLGFALCGLVAWRRLTSNGALA